MILGFLKHCKALSTEKYRRYINILLLLLLLELSAIHVSMLETKESITSLSPNIHKQILQTGLHTFPYRISRTNSLAGPITICMEISLENL